MKITVIKFFPQVLKMIAHLPKDYQVVSVCDPDINGRLLAQHELLGLEYYADPSEAIQKSGCDAVLLTISNYAPQLALLALAYGKDVLLANGVSLGSHADKIHAIAAKYGMAVSP